MEPLIYRERRPPADPLASANRQLVIDIDDVHTLAQGIVDTIRNPLLVLDQDLRVVSANRAFCQTFRMTCQNIEDRAVYALGDGQWNIPALRFLLESIARHRTVMDGYEVEREFPENRATLDAPERAGGGQSKECSQAHSPDDRRCNRAARRRTGDGGASTAEGTVCCRKCSIALQTALQIIAGILLLKARTVQSEETRTHLRDAHRASSCRWRQSNNNCWPQALSIQSASVLISVDCRKPWQPR